MLIDDVLREYLYDIKTRNYTERTMKGYRNNLKKFFAYCKGEFALLEVEEVTHIHIKQYLGFLQDKGLTATYINTILKNIRSFYNYCYNEGYCINIAKKVSWSREKKVIIQTFTDNEVRKMLDVYKYDSYINARNRCIIAVLFDTGIRNFELCNLKRIDVRETTIFILGKGNKGKACTNFTLFKKSND